MTLHWLRVRRARGERPTPIPKPKRPLGPPVLFMFRDVPIRTRADVLAAWGTWEAFLDDVFACWEGDPFRQVQLHHHVECLVPRAGLAAHRNDFARRWREHDEAQERQLAERRYRAAKANEDAIQRQSFFERWMGRAA